MNPSVRPPEAVRIAVFAKAPVAGEVKTRLAPLLGADGAAALHAGLVRRALATATQARVGTVELWCAPDASHAFFERCAAEFRVKLFVQQGKDLGERMRSTIASALSAGDAMVLIGCDCPVMSGDDLRQAAAALDDHDLAIAPAEDGGYVLVAAARVTPDIFDGIAWGSSAVMGQTRARLASAGVNWCELPLRWDIDRPEDYARLKREGLLEEVMS